MVNNLGNKAKESPEMRVMDSAKYIAGNITDSLGAGPLAPLVGLVKYEVAYIKNAMNMKIPEVKDPFSKKRVALIPAIKMSNPVGTVVSTYHEYPAVVAPTVMVNPNCSNTVYTPGTDTVSAGGSGVEFVNGGFMNVYNGNPNFSQRPFDWKPKANSFAGRRRRRKRLAL